MDEQSGREIPSGEPKVHILVRPPRKSEEDDTANVRAVLEHVKEQLPDGIEVRGKSAGPGGAHVYEE